jgi:hypothetical protein
MTSSEEKPGGLITGHHYKHLLSKHIDMPEQESSRVVK